MSAKITSHELTERALIVHWSDGSNNEYPYIWLRDNDVDELHPDTHERTFDLTSVPINIKPQKVNYESSKSDGPARFVIRWPNKEVPSYYQLDWLWVHRPGVGRQDPARIKKQSWADTGQTELPRFDASTCASDPASFLQALVTLKTTGAILIVGLEDSPDAGERFGDLIGFKRETNYGVMFEVKSKPKPNNLAYTSLALPLHTDLANQEFVPGNQFLHCYRNSANGGGSIFADALSIVNDFKRDHPDFYELLSTAQVPWRFVDEENDIRQHRSVIGLYRNGEFKGLTFNAHLADVPDFKSDLMYDFYEAFRELMIRIRTAKNNIETVLKPGEMVIFDNQRILHGRAAFDSTSGERHLRGFYIEHNEIENRIRMLSKQVN